MNAIETPFETLADGRTPFETEALPEQPYLVSFDLGGVRFKTSCDSLALAHEAVLSMDDPEGYSSHSATIYEWAHRAVDGKAYLRTIQRWWFGKLIVNMQPAHVYQPLLDSDGPDYDPDLFVALVDA